MEIIQYNDSLHRLQVIEIWKNIFGYNDARNNPAFLIDSKITVDDHLFLSHIQKTGLSGLSWLVMMGIGAGFTR